MLREQIAPRQLVLCCMDEDYSRSVPFIPDRDIHPMLYLNQEGQKNGQASGEQEQIPG